MTRAPRPVWFLPVCLLAISPAACGKKSTKHDSPATVAELFAASDLAPPGQLATVTAADMPANLANSSAVYDVQPGSTTPTTTACSPLEDAQTITATATTMTVSYSLNETDCQNKTPSGDGSVYKTNQLSTSLWITCTGADLSVYNGKNGKSLTLSAVLAKCTAATLKIESLANIVSTSPTTTTNVKYSSVQAHADLTPCQLTVSNGISTFDNSCVDISKLESSFVNAGATTTSNSYFKFAFTGVSNDATASEPVWHKGGQLDVVYNSWTGSLKYTAAATAPTYSLTDASGATITGTLTAVNVNALANR